MIEFEKEENISMIRFWNYNVNRTKSYRGVRNIAILDSKMKIIFMGEIKRALGTIHR